MKSKISTLFFILAVFAFPQEPIKIVSSDFNSIVLEFTPVYSEAIEQNINNQKFLRINFQGGFNISDEWGEPAVQGYNLNIGVPSETGNTIEVLNSVYKEIDGKLIPVPKPVQDDFLEHYEYETGENYFNYSQVEELVAFGEFGVIRNIKAQTIKILPVKFYPSAEKIRLYTSIVFRINFAPSTISTNPAKDDFVSDAIINYPVAQHWAEKKNRLLKGVPASSILAQGKWIRFEAPEEGFYKITRSMLSSYGIDVNIDPRTIKIYNNGGKVLSEKPLNPRPVDLVENAIWIIGEEDGRFDETDYILFYGRGNKFWDYDTTTAPRAIRRFLHPYSNANYYWITSGGANGKRIQNKPSLSTTAGFIQTSTYAFADWETDRINLGKSGRKFVGDDFSLSMPSRTYMNMLHNWNGYPLQYNFRFVNGAAGSFTLKIYENQNVNSIPIFTRFLNGYGNQEHVAGTEIKSSISYNGLLPENRSVLKFEIGNGSGDVKGYLDYFEIMYQRELKPTNNYLLFFSSDTSAIIEYQLSNFSSTNIKVFDVTDYSDIKFISDHTMLSGGEYHFQVQEAKRYISKYLAVGNDDYKTPSNPVEVNNSNIRGISDGAKFIIITHKNFLEAANRLKSYRENESLNKLSTIIINIDEIFNEFSCGIVDVSAVRDFLKYAFDNWAVTPDYVLFFGSGNYDYKNIEGYNTNYIPTWQSEESLYLIDSYTMDDFFVNLTNDSVIDLAPGRITVKSLSEAQNYIDKVIEYENNNDLGTWRNLVTLVADDAYTSEGRYEPDHTDQTEDIANTFPEYVDKNKIYMASYPVVLTGSGKRIPDVNKRIIESINDGTLVVNYIGHGNDQLWAHEVVFDRNISIPQLHNTNKYFFLVAATCSFGYFDIPNSRSGSEDLVFLPGAGSIASLTASRVVFSDQNFYFNREFTKKLYSSPRDSNGYPITIGKANFLTKGIVSGANSQKYYLLGDPTLRLNIPTYQADIDSINDRSVSVSNIQLKALGKVRLHGVVKKPDNSLWENYNGEGVLNVYDSERTQLIYNIPVRISGGIIFRGRISIVNGRFNAEFVVPKDISYENRQGKIVLYFYSNNEDGIGFTNKVTIGGTDSTAVNDGTGPEIDIYFDDPSYINSSLINPDSKLIIKLSDDTGINTTGTGVGHKLEGILNDNDAAPLDFSGYFTGDLDAGGKSGEVNYTFEDLETGDYKLDVKAWDVFNNFSTETAYFSLVTGGDMVLRDVYNYPNPFSAATTFTFQQNLNSSLNVEVKVYTVAGRLIRAIKKDNIDERFVTIDWDGRDDDGDMLANGTYLYKLIVKSTDGQYSKSVLGKLAVIR